MAIIVNTNMASINAQRSLTKVDRSLDKALERLASGLRINRAGDDAAGLAIANGLATQVRGLTVASRNASDGLSLIGAAEGAVGQQTEILQRIRELAVQAANDINSGANRAQIQEEIDQQIEELTRVGNTVEFNGQKLIDGTFSNKSLQVGAYSGQTISISLGDFRAAGMGSLAQTTNQTAIVYNAALATNTLFINNVGVDDSANYADTVSTVGNGTSAIAKAAAINAVYDQTNVEATVLAATMQTTIAIAAGTAAAGNSLTINGVTVYSYSASNPLVTTLGDGTRSLTTKINEYSAQTGVTASVDTATNKLVLTAADGRNIAYTTAGGVTNFMGTAAAGSIYGAGQLKLTSTDSFSMTGTAAATSIGFTLTGGINIAKDVNINVSAIDVTTFQGASDALDIIDAALSQVSTAQSQLGAITNRLENTISNLAVSVENMQAAESRIRDADFAQETANLTRAQIIQQAGVSVLSQANLRPQSALALLGG